jgi:hypothetical protein
LSLQQRTYLKYGFVVKIALHARASTRDKGQDTENQLAQLREFARRISGAAATGSAGQETEGERSRGKKQHECGGSDAFEIPNAQMG